MDIRNYVNAKKAAIGAALLAPMAMLHAAPIDVTAVVAEINDQKAPINAIGGAVLGLAVAIFAWRWVRRAMG